MASRATYGRHVQKLVSSQLLLLLSRKMRSCCPDWSGSIQLQYAAESVVEAHGSIIGGCWLSKTEGLRASPEEIQKPCTRVRGGGGLAPRRLLGDHSAALA